MQVTRRFWTVALVGIVFSLGAVAFERPVLFGGAIGIGAWLVAVQIRFVHALGVTDDRLTVDRELSRPQVGTDEPSPVTLTVAVDGGALLPLSVLATAPVGTRGGANADSQLTLGTGDETATTVFQVEAPVAGSYTFEQVHIQALDRTGLFTETITRGPTPTLTVEPRAPRDVHVGKGGEEVAAAFGEHETGRLGSGIEPAEIREYQAGDEAHRIDWKATARLNHPYIREYETETDRVSALLFDQRSSMHQGPPGETKLDYLRQVALAFVNSARSLRDPIGLYLVGDEGTRGVWDPNAGHSQYTRLRGALHGLDASPEQAAPQQQHGPRQQIVAGRTPASARNAAELLAADESPFGEILRPYFVAADPYVARIESDPLYGTATQYISGVHGRIWTVIFTDDTHRAELRETVKRARHGEDHVLVFLTPTVLFRPGGLGDIDAAYTEYRTFEEFRRSLSRLPRVTALEVGPGDRLDAVLRAGRQRRATDRHQQEVEANE